jgi:peptidoglycan hydrolase-like protein with peptidoglycan-binding domain
MKITPIAVAVAAAMFALPAVANEQSKDKQAEGAQPPMSQDQKAGSSTSASGGMSASGGASAPSSPAASSSSSEEPKAATSSSSSEPSKGASASGEAKSSGKAQSQAQSSQGQDPELIKQAQTKLNVTADGKVGPETQKAVKEFQQSKGLKASGQLDQETIAALGVNESASAGGSSAPQAGSSTTEQKPQQAPAPSSTKQQ